MYTLDNASTSERVDSYQGDVDFPICSDLNLEPGTYDIAVSASGYEPLQESLTVTVGGNNTFSYELTPE